MLTNLNNNCCKELKGGWNSRNNNKAIYFCNGSGKQKLRPRSARLNKYFNNKFSVDPSPSSTKMRPYWAPTNPPKHTIFDFLKTKY